MDTHRDSAHQFQNEENFPTFSLRLNFLNDAEKEKNNGKGDSASAPSRFACPRVKCNTDFDRKTLVKPNKWQTGLFQPSKVNLNFSVLKLLNVKLELSTEKFEIKPIPILLNISLTANNHFWYCCPFFASALMHNSTSYVIKQSVQTFSCALSSYGALGKFGEHQVQMMHDVHWCVTVFYQQLV